MSNELTKREEARAEAVSEQRWLKPACDVYENDNEWLITADLPGVAKDALSLHLDKSDLTIEGRRSEGKWNQGFAGYRRTFSVPAGVESDKVEAKMNQGVVTIHLAKAEAIKPRQITVTAG